MKAALLEISESERRIAARPVGLLPSRKMNRINPRNWGFEKIRAVDEGRAAWLESAGSCDALVGVLVKALNEAIDRRDFRIAVDSRNNAFVERRSIVQFQIFPRYYDWFFSARTGYRAQFWINPAAGRAFNCEIMRSLADVLARRLPAMLTARRIEVRTGDGVRQEKDTGTIEIPCEEIARSLAPDRSKIWIGERLYSNGRIDEIGFAVLSDAARNNAKLSIPKWAEAINPKTGERGEGLRAPSPGPEESWLDLKGGFLLVDGESAQIKPQDERAEQINECGWT